MSGTSTSHFTERLSDKISFDMIHVEGARFMMGDDEKDWMGNKQTIHQVKLPAFYIAQFPVTQRLWESIMGANSSIFSGPNRPVEMVSWEDCQEFLKSLNEQTGKAYRLPTEAEWEYAAKGGQNSQGCIYSGSDKLKEVGWFDINSHGETKAVGQKIPNGLGIYDMSGNVWEWCEDWYSGTYYQECAKIGLIVNPSGPKNATNRMIRGGSWYDSKEDSQVRYRRGWLPGYQSGRHGFRLAMSLQSAD